MSPLGRRLASTLELGDCESILRVRAEVTEAIAFLTQGLPLPIEDLEHLTESDIQASARGVPGSKLSGVFEVLQIGVALRMLFCAQKFRHGPLGTRLSISPVIDALGATLREAFELDGTFRTAQANTSAKFAERRTMRERLQTRLQELIRNIDTIVQENDA